MPLAIQQAASHTYVYALSNALHVAGSLATVGALIAWLLIKTPAYASRRQPEQAQQPEPSPAELAAAG